MRMLLGGASGLCARILTARFSAAAVAEDKVVAFRLRLPLENVERCRQGVGIVQQRAEPRREVRRLHVVGHFLFGGVAHLRERDARRHSGRSWRR